jgi:hypothetical protein
MTTHQRLVAVLATLGLLILVFDLVRRRRLLERYALVWMVVTVFSLPRSGSSLCCCCTSQWRCHG